MSDLGEDRYRFLTLDVTVRCGHEVLAAALRWHLAPFHRRPSQAPAVLVEVVAEQENELRYVREGIEQRRGPPRRILRHALWDLQALVPARVPGFLFLHAGAVVSDGRAVLMVGEMGSGKSVLTAALLQRGCAYLSDEFGVVDLGTTAAHPFEKRIVLDTRAVEFLPGLDRRLRDREGLSAELPDRYADPADLGAAVAGPAPVGRVVLLGPLEDGPPRLLPVAGARAAIEMARQCLNLAQARREGLDVLTRLAATAEVFRVEGGSPGERADLISTA